jgi:hypothetical protein
MAGCGAADVEIGEIEALAERYPTVAPDLRAIAAAVRPS